MFGIESVEGDGEGDEREDAKDDAGSDLGVGEEEAGDAGEDGGQKEDAVPRTEKSAVDETEENDESGGDADEADDDVKDGVGRRAHSKNHGVSSLCSVARIFAAKRRM